MKLPGKSMAVMALLLLGPAGHAAPDLAWLEDGVALRNFVGGAVAEQLAQQQAVGVTVSIVRGEAVLLAQGYGLADRAGAMPVVAPETLFRIGSVTKLFVWVAVMQQVAAGKLDLDADVNTYLSDLHIPQVYPETITLRHLMTHTAGFEDRLLGLFAQGPRTVGDFHDNLRTMLPRTVMMPGRHVAYSNYGAALAAHLVEEASGEAWDDYVEHNILNPLGMLSTTTRQPVGDALETRMARGYWWESDRYEPAPFEFVTLPPAGSISATSTDMARFMSELLARGDTAVLSATARAQLFGAGFSHDARLNGMRNGPYEMNSHGRNLVGHDGDTMAFHSRLLLDPALDLGIFVSYNSDRGPAREALIRAITDRLYGVERVEHAAKGAATPQRFDGYYTSLRAPVSGHDKIMSLIGTVRVSTAADGMLELQSPQGTYRFVALGDDLFAQVDGSERLAFRVDGGRATHLFVDSQPMIELARVAPRDDPRLQLAVVAAAFVLSAAVFVCWPLSWWRHRGRIALRGEWRATLLGVTHAALVIGFFVGLGSVGGPHEVVFGLPEQFQRALWVPFILIATLLLQLVYSYRAWLAGWWWPTRRIHYTLLTLSGIALVAWTFYWHLTAIILDW